MVQRIPEKSMYFGEFLSPDFSALSYYALRICSDNIFFSPEKVARDAETSIKFQEFSSPPRGHDGGFRARLSGKLTGGKFN